MVKNRMGQTKGFRPRGKTAERIEVAEKLGMNISDLVNKVLDKHLRQYLEAEVEQRKLEYRRLIEAPIP